MTHEELLAKVDWIGKTKNAESNTHTALSLATLNALNSLRAVVEMHKHLNSQIAGGQYNLCQGCHETYPCPTVQAIEKELK